MTFFLPPILMQILLEHWGWSKAKTFVQVTAVLCIMFSESAVVLEVDSILVIWIKTVNVLFFVSIVRTPLVHSTAAVCRVPYPTAVTTSAVPSATTWATSCSIAKVANTVSLTHAPLRLNYLQSTLWIHIGLYFNDVVMKVSNQESTCPVWMASSRRKVILADQFDMQRRCFFAALALAVFKLEAADVMLQFTYLPSFLQMASVILSVEGKYLLQSSNRWGC